LTVKAQKLSMQMWILFADLLVPQQICTFAARMLKLSVLQ